MRQALIIIAMAILAAGCGDVNHRAENSEPIKVVVLTGGHEFEHDPFFTLFEGYEDIVYVEKELKVGEPAFEDISGWDYDVIVFYNMTDAISETGKRNLLSLLGKGVGVLAVHHSIPSFQQWPEYKKIIGCKYYHNKTQEDGIVYEKGTYKHDVDIAVKVAWGGHPVTRGLRDFTINDEVYKGQSFEPDNIVLLTTDHPLSDKTLCSVKKYSKANVCCIQPGHGPGTYNDANYRRLVAQAIRWCAGRAQ